MSQHEFQVTLPIKAGGKVGLKDTLGQRGINVRLYPLKARQMQPLDCVQNILGGGLLVSDEREQLHQTVRA